MSVLCGIKWRIDIRPASLSIQTTLVMLTHLHIENIVLIERLVLDFGPGLTILTGETGAGKSILLDALRLALGQRVDTGLVRAGTNRAEVSATFQPPPKHPVWAWLLEQGLDEADGSLIVRRLLSRDGRSRATINQRPVPASALATLGALLLELHGQHQQTALLAADTPRTMLDAFGGHGAQSEAVAHAYDLWHTTQQKLEALLKREQEQGERRAFLEFQIRELEQAGVEVGEASTLVQRRKRLRHAVSLAKAAEQAMALLSSAPEQTAIETTGRAAGCLEGVLDQDPALQPIAEAVRSLHYELEAASEALERYHLGLETDPTALTEVDERLHLLNTLARKHRCEADDLPERLANWQRELGALDRIEEDRTQLETACLKGLEHYTEAARRLSLARQQTAQRLTARTSRQLAGLAMAKTRFEVRVEPRTGTTAHPHGLDEISLHLAANPGEPMQPLAKAASGGELSRIMLALKSALADAVATETLIFDEVDVGVGGKSAAAIGARLAGLAARRQVLAITHLPQVAAYGDVHLQVTKASRKDRTHATIRRLEGEARITELARMLAGSTITESARRNAQDLLKAAHG